VSTTYELASRFGFHRVTVSKFLNREGVSIRIASLTADQVNEAIKFYCSGLSLVDVG
jgi:DNA-binding LacI/PurR family transcriptional regulator